MLRLLHTSDWHLGQMLRDRERVFEHEQFLDWLCGVVQERAIDGLLVAGDVFDVANPSATAQRTFYEFIARLHLLRPSIQVVVVAGNHDSPSRLEAPGPLVEVLGASVIGQVPWGQADDGGVNGPVLDDLIVPLRDATGTVQGWCLAVPYLRPGDVPRVEGDERERYALGIASLYRQLTERARVRRAPGQAIVAMGHATILGGREPMSERSAAIQNGVPSSRLDEEESINDAIRPILLGGLERLQVDMFADDIAYVALGHLHRASTLGKKGHIRYSGSPIPLSFAERCYRHRVVFVELDGERASCIEDIEVPRRVAMLRIPQQRSSLSEVIAALHAWQPDPEHVSHPVWLEIAVDADSRRVFDLVAQLDDALRDKPVHGWKLADTAALELATSDRRSPTVDSLDEVGRLLDPEALLLEAWRRVSPVNPLPEDLADGLRELLATEVEA